MKKKLTFILLSVAVLCCSVSCKQILCKEVVLLIPEHPWEKSGDRAMWYSLVYTSGGQTKTLYIDTKTREVTIMCPIGETVFVCAYPLGNMRPFGCAITPLSDSLILLDQNSGYIADIIIQGALETASEINAARLVDCCNGICNDFRYIDEENLLVDILNGQLSEGSVRTTNGFTLENISVYPGTWISESVYDGVLDPASITLPAGVHRFYNFERNLEMRIVVNTDGSWNKIEAAALIPSSD